MASVPLPLEGVAWWRAVGAPGGGRDGARRLGWLRCSRPLVDAWLGVVGDLEIGGYGVRGSSSGWQGVAIEDLASWCGM